MESNFKSVQPYKVSLCSIFKISRMFPKLSTRFFLSETKKKFEFPNDANKTTI